MHQAPDEEVAEALKLAAQDLRVVAKLVTRLWSKWPKPPRDLERPTEEGLDRRKRRPKVAEERHLWQFALERWQCCKCLLSCYSLEGRHRRDRLKCKSGLSPLKALEASAASTGHLLYQADCSGTSLVFCLHCGKYGTVRFANLLAKCAAERTPAGLFAVHRIASGWHPTKAIPVVQVVRLGHAGPEFQLKRPAPALPQTAGQPSAGSAKFEAVRARVARKEAEQAEHS